MTQPHGWLREQAPVPPARSYFICATPRSGSTLLCERLTASGIAGSPSEWMLPSNEGLAREMFGIAPRFADPTYFAELLTGTASPNGVFGAKLMWPQMAQLLRGELWNLRIGPPQAGIITLPDLRYIRIVRRDRVRQAVSFLLAQRTNRWQRLATQNDPLVAAAQRAGFETGDNVPAGWTLPDIRAMLADPQQRMGLLDDIAACLTEIEQQSREWDRFFAAFRAAPCNVEYEDLVANPAAVLARVLRFLDLERLAPIDFSRGLLQPMSDGRNAALVAAYMAAHAR